MENARNTIIYTPPEWEWFQAWGPPPPPFPGDDDDNRWRDLVYHKLPPELLQLGASRGDQVSITGGTRKTAADVARSPSTDWSVLAAPKFFQLPRQFLDFRHGQRELLFFLVEEGPNAVQIGGCE